MPETLTEEQVFARRALLEVTPEATIGSLTGEVDEGDHVRSYLFETTMPGYPGWNWTVTIAHLPDEHPTVVETELTPADGALLAPEWVPWSERMEDYRAAQLALGEAAAAELASAESSDDDSDDDDDDDDDDDFGSDVLHSGDLDGVDIEELDADALDAESSDVDDDDSDDDDSDDDESDDGLDAPANGVDQHDDAEREPIATHEDPPRVPARRKRAHSDQQHNQSD
jgi:hypothetical protein